MRKLLAICALGMAMAACMDEGMDAGSDPSPAPVKPGSYAVVYEAGQRLAQCGPIVVTVAQSASKLTVVGVPVQRSSCGVRTGVFYPAVCGAGTSEIILHNIPNGSLPAAEAAGFQSVATLVDAARQRGWQRSSCDGYRSFRDRAMQSAGCAQTRNRLLSINSNAMLDRELVLLDQAGTCADAAYRQALFGDSADDVLCSNAQTIAGPMKSCTAASYGGLFDTIIANLDKADLGLGPGYVIIEMAL